MQSSETIKVVPARYRCASPGRYWPAGAGGRRAVGRVQSALGVGVFAHWFFDPVILEGLGQTLLLTLLGTF